MLVLSIIIGLLLVDFIVYSIYFRFCYAKNPLNIITFDGSNEPYHPSVLYTKSWNGYTFWMSLTPYPMRGAPYRSRWECPCIYHSRDGISWNNIDTINPIDNLTSLEIERKDFFSDSHLVLTFNGLECWYRITCHSERSTDTFVVRKTSKDGLIWSEREVLIDLTNEDILLTLGDMVRSLSILYDDAYKMWYVDNKSCKGERHLCCSTSADGRRWSMRTICKLLGPSVNPWHIDVAYIDEAYWLTLYDLKRLTLWKSDDGINFVFIQILLAPSLVYGSFYSDGLYRSVLVKTDKDYRLYFSAYNHCRTSIGVMKGKTIDQMKVMDVPNIHVKNQYLKIYLYNRKRLLSVVKSKVKTSVSTCIEN